MLTLILKRKPDRCTYPEAKAIIPEKADIIVSWYFDGQVEIV